VNANANASLQKPAKPRPAKPAAAPGTAELLLKLDRAEQRNQALEAENTRLLSDIAVLRQQLKQTQGKPAPQQAHSKRAVTAHDKALIEAMGLAKWNLNEQQTLEISHVVGELVLETMSGLMQVLGFRKQIKEEFRINVTTIRPVENNPLKFSANLDDAMENMFIKNNKAYQKPVVAVREGFQGIAEHQVAVLAGVQAAFRGMIERFDPEALERRFEKYRKAGVIKVGQKGKNWDAYKEFHQDLINNMDNSFQHLFGYDFVQAYENQLQKLAMSRKASGFGNSDNNN
jgi:type VI secretion system protein